MADSEVPHSTGALVEIYVRNYGPFAFGVGTLLVLWFAIVKPQMDRQSVDFDSQQKVVKELVIAIEANRQTALNLERVSVILDSITKKLEKIQ